MPAERTIRLDLAYDGTGFRGWARQRDPRIRTIEGSILDVLGWVLGASVRLSVAGRTDAGRQRAGTVRVRLHGRRRQHAGARRRQHRLLLLFARLREHPGREVRLHAGRIDRLLHGLVVFHHRHRHRLLLRAREL